MIEMSVINFVEILVSAKGYWKQVSHIVTSDHRVEDYCVLQVSECGQQIHNESK